MSVFVLLDSGAMALEGTEDVAAWSLSRWGGIHFTLITVASAALTGVIFAWGQIQSPARMTGGQS